MEVETDDEAGAAVQLAFVGWLRERQPNLAVQIVGIRATGAGLEFALQGWPELEGSVTAQGVDVAAIWDGDCWDVLLSLDVVPVQQGSEWACSICESESRSMRFASREALWRDHLFDPLGEWIVDKLATAERTEFHRTGAGSTWARLV